MSKFREGDLVRVTYGGSIWFDHVLTVCIITADVVWVQSDDSPELIPFHERKLILADHEREAAL